MQYDEERKVIVIDDTFLSTAKRTLFKTDSAETFVFQKYDNEDKINNY